MKAVVEFQFTDEKLFHAGDYEYVDGFGTITRGAKSFTEPPDEDVFDFVELNIIDMEGELIYSKTSPVLGQKEPDMERIQDIALQHCI